MLDLYNVKYSREVLKKNIYALHLLSILKTQKIDCTFAARYILNPKYQLLKEEQEITCDLVLFFQPHILKKELERELKLYDSDEDSVDNFEIISKEDLDDDK